ncbi:hypothetical protein ACVBEJ_14420, partial [Porticoccus sp. GXU_MW_L64]
MPDLLLKNSRHSSVTRDAHYSAVIQGVNRFFDSFFDPTSKHAKHKQNQKLNQQQTSTKSSLQNYMTSPARDAHNSAQK